MQTVHDFLGTLLSVFVDESFLPVKRSLLSGNVDGTVIMEPIPTALQVKDAPFERIT
ncbi:hypothetical protein [Halorientalis regularis]|uniref:hypothetical protein n=1 Tax=Halorientalis regularis TaxID=660518 RepID=UPI001FE1E527|nr:hypothetical protein [Halorientalis regularis]